MTSWSGYGLPAQDPDPLPDPGHEPRGPHCGVGSRPKPGRAEYRCCPCGQWYWWTGALWTPVAHPPRGWLREHGIDPDDLWDAGGGQPRTRLFSDFPVRRPPLLAILRYLFRS